MGDRLLNELIESHARQLGWFKWKVSGEREISFFELAGNIVGGIGGPNLPLAPIPGPAIIVIPSLSLHVQHTSSAEAVYGGILVSFYRNTATTDIIGRTLSFKTSFIINNGAAHHYRADLSCPLVFKHDTTAVIAANCSTAFTAVIALGKALIINRY